MQSLRTAARTSDEMSGLKIGWNRARIQSESPGNAQEHGEEEISAKSGNKKTMFHVRFSNRLICAVFRSPLAMPDSGGNFLGFLDWVESPDAPHCVI